MMAYAMDKKVTPATIMVLFFFCFVASVIFVLGAGSDKPTYSMFPLLTVNSATDLWQNHPSYAAQELSMMALATWIYVRQVRGSDKATRLLFWTTMIGGNLIEVLTAFHPEVGCFWESQAFLMVLGSRIPVYCVWGMYIVMGYVPSKLVEAAGLDGLLAESCLCALLGGFFYATFGVFGTQNLWWTFHTDDKLFTHRHADDPAAHPFWICAQCWGCHLAWRLACCRVDLEALDEIPFFCLAFVCGTAGYLVLMVLPFLAFYHSIVFIGRSGYVALHLFRLVCLVAVVYGVPSNIRTKVPSASGAWKKVVMPNVCIVLAWLLLVACCAFMTRPEDIVRIGWGQDLGLDCFSQEQSFWSLHTRTRQLCPSALDHVGNFRECSSAPLVADRARSDASHFFWGEDGDSPERSLGARSDDSRADDWSRVCGTPKEGHHLAWLAAQFAGTLLFTGVAAGLAAAGSAKRTD